MTTLTPNAALSQALDAYIHTLELALNLGGIDHDLRLELIKAVHLRHRMRKGRRLYKRLRSEMYSFLDLSLSIFCEQVIERGMSDNEVTLFRNWIQCTDLFRKA